MSESKVPWNTKKWQETKRQVKMMEEDWEMKNKEIQDKILELLKKENSQTRGL